MRETLGEAPARRTRSDGPLINAAAGLLSPFALLFLYFFFLHAAHVRPRKKQSDMPGGRFEAVARDTAFIGRLDGAVYFSSSFLECRFCKRDVAYLPFFYRSARSIVFEFEECRLSF